MGHLLAIVLPLALGAAVSPTLLALQLLTLSRPQRPLARAWAVAAGAALVLAGYGVLAFALARSTGGSGSPDEAGAIVKLVAAVLLLALGARQLRAPARDAPPKRERTPAHPLRQSFALGAAVMLTNFSTIVLFFPATHEIGVDDAALGAKVVAFALLYVVTLAPALGPPLVVTLMGARATPLLERLNRFFTARRRAIGAGICFLFAALLGAAGLHALL